MFIHNISSKNDHETTTDREIFRNIRTGPSQLELKVKCCVVQSCSVLNCCSFSHSSLAIQEFCGV